MQNTMVRGGGWPAGEKKNNELGEKNEKGKLHYNRGKGLKNASFWAINSKKNRRGVFRPNSFSKVFPKSALYWSWNFAWMVLLPLGRISWSSWRQLELTLLLLLPPPMHSGPTLPQNFAATGKYTVCPRSSDPFQVVTYYIKSVTSTCSYSIYMVLSIWCLSRAISKFSSFFYRIKVFFFIFKI